MLAADCEGTVSSGICFCSQMFTSALPNLQNNSTRRSPVALLASRNHRQKQRVQGSDIYLRPQDALAAERHSKCPGQYGKSGQLPGICIMRATATSPVEFTL